MKGLFVLSRTWGYQDSWGAFRTQALDGDYINTLCSDYEQVALAMVVVDPLEFDFVSRYEGRLAKQVRVVQLRQTVRGNLLVKLHAQFWNFVVSLREIRASEHVAVFMSSLSAVWSAIFAKLFNKKLLVYSGNDWAVDTSLKYRREPKWARKLAMFVTDKLETVVLGLADVRLLNSPRLFEKCRHLSGKSERVRPVSRFRLADAFVRFDTCVGRVARIVYPAAIVPRKNHATLLLSVAMLQARGLETELLLAGAAESDQIVAELKEQATALGIADRVRFVGYLAAKDEMLALLRGVDVFVLPSLNEGFPRVIWEAMLQSLPCAVSRIPNIVADIGQRDVALLFDPADPEDLANALERIITDGELRRHLIRRSHAYAREVFAEGWNEQLTRVLREWD